MNVLIADDDTVSRRMLAVSVQGWDYTVFPVDNGLSAFELLAKLDGPRLALLDWEMPGMDGIEVCCRLRSVPGLPFRYLIVLTGRDREEDIVAALERGADDFITKPWIPGELRARLGVGRRMVQLHEQLEENGRQLALAAQTDYLTGIWNRSAVLRRLEEELSRAKRECTPLALLMLDVDHFKSVNDSYGHQAGDAVLKEVALRLRRTCRPYDVVGRYGGEEFVAVIPGASYEQTEAVAQRFRELVAATPICTDRAAIAITVSVGGAWLAPAASILIPPGIGSNSSALLKTADEMMYRAKEHGRNRVMLRSLDGSSSNNGEC